MTWLMFVIIATFGVITLLIPAFLALIENDMEKIIAYSTVSQMGYIILALGFGSALGLTAALFHMFNHALLKSMLFLAAGAVIYATGTRDITKLGGLISKTPITALAVLVGGLAVAGLPPLNGFASKLLIYEAGLEASFRIGGVIGRLYLLYTLIAIFVSALTLLYFMRLFYSVFLGLPSKLTLEARKVPLIMKMPLMILATFSIIIGVAPQIIVGSLINPAVVNILGLSKPSVEVTFLGYSTSIGFYSATILTLVLLASASIVLLIYYISLTFYKRTTLPPVKVVEELKDFKYEVFTGGEASPPLLPLEETKVTPEEFVFALKTAFSKPYAFSMKGGYERLIIRAAKKIFGFSKEFDIIRFENVSSYVTLYVLIALIVLLYVLR